MLEFQHFQDKIRKELRARMKFSRDLLELRDKEAKLVRSKRYEEAEKIKMKADLLEEFERNKLEAEVRNSCANFLLDASSPLKERGKVAPHSAIGFGCPFKAHSERSQRTVETSPAGLVAIDSEEQEYSQRFAEQAGSRN